MSRIQVKVDWDAVKSDPVEFAAKLLTDPAGNPVILHPAQAQILRGIHRWTTIVTGRQFGKSTALEVDATWFGATHPNRTIMVAAPSLEQAKIIFNGIVNYYRKPPLNLLVQGKIREYPFPEIHLTNGTTYICRGANSPQYMRGNRIHRFYGDEWAFVKDGVTGDVVEPMFTVTGQEEDSAQILTGTPFGRGAFYDYYQLGDGNENEHDPLYKSFHFTSYDNPHADRVFLEKVKERHGENSLLWRTEYLGLFDTDDRAVFGWNDIRYMYEEWPHGDDFPIKPVEKHRYIQGVDLANLRDYFVASVVDDTDPNAIELVRLDRHQKKGYPFYKRLVRSNYATYRPRTLVDATSLGQSVAQDLSDIGADGYAMSSSAAKWEIIQELARLVSERRLRIPPRRDIIDEFRYFEYEVTAGKQIKAEASRGHDDIVMSLALAAHLCAVPRRLGLFRSVGAPGIKITPEPPSKQPLQKALPAPQESEYDPFVALWSYDDDDDDDD